MQTMILYVLLFLISGTVTGVAGFGFAILSTVALTSILEPSTAIALVIPSFVAVNASLLTNLNYKQLKSCTRRFYPYLATILITSVIGMASLSLIPENPLRASLGAITILFVATQLNQLRTNITTKVEDKCFVESPKWMITIGSISGLIFGSTNIGVQMVAYLESCNLPKQVFTGVIGLTFIGVNLVRFGVAIGTGMYQGPNLIALSLALAIPSSIGVLIGSKMQDRASDKLISTTIYITLTTIGVYLLLAGLRLM